MIQDLYRRSFAPFGLVGLSLIPDSDPISALVSRNSSYPPHNIEQKGENSFLLSFAVAGFTPDELTVQEADGVLTVAGSHIRQTDEKESIFLHRGIASRAFTLSFRLAQYVKAGAAQLSNGILSIELTREIPDTAKPRRIDIGIADGAKPSVSVNVT